MFIEAVSNLKQSRIKQWPVKSNRASSLGHECLRYLVFERTRWEEKSLHGIDLQFIFDEGNLHEGAVLRDLQDAGLALIEQQRAFEWKKYNITGHIDAKIIQGSSVWPIEIKSCSPFVFDSISSIEDLRKSKYHHLRGYPSQLCLYLLMDSKPEGFFIFKNKTSGRLKEIMMQIDWDLGESLLQKAEAINIHVNEQTIPPCDYREDVCENCGYLHICLPEIKRDALEIKTDPELEGKLRRLAELKPLSREYGSLDKEIKAAFKEKPKLVMGDYLITGKWVERQPFSVGASKYWRTDIKYIGA